jgi:dethiobiotin synthetase
MKGLFITGTDTDVGKTALTALLLAELRRRGSDAAPMKPVQTGCSGDNVPDLDYSLSMAQMRVSDDDCKSMCPYRFEPACSPHLAAEMAATEIDIAEIIIAARSLASEYEFILAEGAGGILVPINRRETMLDLMQALKFPILLAARPGLGTINHTLLSIRTLRSDGLEIAGVVFIAGTGAEPGLIEEDNAATIEQFGKVPVLGTIPFCETLQSPNPRYDDLPIPVVAEVEKIVNQLNL